MSSVFLYLGIFSSLRLRLGQCARFAFGFIRLSLRAACLLMFAAAYAECGRPKPLSIESGPFPQATLAGQSAVFDVQASGIWPYAYQWFHDGKALIGATNATLSI